MSEIGSGNGTSYPTAVDTNATTEVNSPSANKTKARAEVPNDHSSAIVAIETELGTLPKGTAATVKDRLNAIELAASQNISEEFYRFQNINHMDVRLLPIGPELHELREVDAVDTVR